ncbi:hypothetical protein BN1195_03624 [Chryseobacterium oranimense G311]|uniref:hypothetical protein n=1 Tax=Chryseobacterium oranimense TaxID=421058 RepID=UPI000533B2D8|nr:hypothetical protein [Chryseobacterium oranimense]CEJ71279.1 hypothetical protein BN1195_03624 [Chryseobacterium oranimense G311]
MKQLELELQKRLLVIEIDESLETLHIHSWNNQPLEFICKGPDFTEDIAKGFVLLINENSHLSYYADYNNKSGCGYYTNSIRSFISAIESKGYYWGEIKSFCYSEEIDPFTGYSENNKKEVLKEAQSRTFNLEKTIIFEIP